MPQLDNYLIEACLDSVRKWFIERGKGTLSPSIWKVTHQSHGWGVNLERLTTWLTEWLGWLRMNSHLERNLRKWLTQLKHVWIQLESDPSITLKKL